MSMDSPIGDPPFFNDFNGEPPWDTVPPWYYPIVNPNPGDPTITVTLSSTTDPIVPERPRIGTRAFFVDRLRWEILEGFFQKIVGSLDTDDNSILPIYVVVTIIGRSEEEMVNMEDAFVKMDDAIEHLKAKAVR